MGTYRSRCRILSRPYSIDSRSLPADAPGSPLRCANRSLNVTCSVTHESLRTTLGAYLMIGSSQANAPFSKLFHFPPPTSPATIVDDTGLDSEAIWNTVSACTGSFVLGGADAVTVLVKNLIVEDDGHGD